MLATVLDRDQSEDTGALAVIVEPLRERRPRAQMFGGSPPQRSLGEIFVARGGDDAAPSVPVRRRELGRRGQSRRASARR